MRLIRYASGLGLAALLLAPAAALAGLAIDPDRVNGTFDFVDRDEGINNTLEFELEGRSNGIEGTVQANAGADLVTISYTADFPNGLTAGERNASLRQNRQVLIRLQFTPFGSPTPSYDGQAAPARCKVQAKVHGANDPDDPDRADARLTCDLDRDWVQLAGDPPAAVLTAVEEAFEPRKDVKVNTRSGKLQIKHKGEPE